MFFDSQLNRQSNLVAIPLTHPQPPFEPWSFSCQFIWCFLRALIKSPNKFNKLIWVTQKKRKKMEEECRSRLDLLRVALRQVPRAPRFVLVALFIYFVLLFFFVAFCCCGIGWGLAGVCQLGASLIPLSTPVSWHLPTRCRSILPLSQLHLSCLIWTAL